MNLKRHGKLLSCLLLAAVSPCIQGATTLTANRDARLLAAHNYERSTANLPALEWSDDLAESATAWAEHLRRLGDIKHSETDPSDPDPEGENLWAGTKGYYSPEDMVSLWIIEKKHYKAGLFPNNSRTGNVEHVGHYTQLMWRSSTHVGCAVTAGQKEEYLVCRYSEGGNVIGERPF